MTDLALLTLAYQGLLRAGHHAHEPNCFDPSLTGRCNCGLKGLMLKLDDRLRNHGVAEALIPSGRNHDEH